MSFVRSNFQTTNTTLHWCHEGFQPGTRCLNVLLSVYMKNVRTLFMQKILKNRLSGIVEDSSFKWAFEMIASPPFNRDQIFIVQHLVGLPFHSNWKNSSTSFLKWDYKTGVWGNFIDDYYITLLVILLICLVRISHNSLINFIRL